MCEGGNAVKQKIYYFFETWFISLFLTIFISFTLINFILDFYNAYQSFIEVTLGRTLYSLKGSLLSIAAIFIGIYVTVFTLLGSIKVDSVFAYLNEHTFKKLITYIRNAFIASFSYLVLVLIIEVKYSDYTDIDFIFIVINASIVIYMFLTAFRFGVILYISFNRDLQNLQKNIKEHRKEKKKEEELKYRMGKFLNEFERERERRDNDKMSNIINPDKEDK